MVVEVGREMPNNPNTLTQQYLWMDYLHCPTIECLVTSSALRWLRSFEGMSYRDINRHLQFLYGVSSNPSMIYKWALEYVERGHEIIEGVRAYMGVERPWQPQASSAAG